MNLLLATTNKDKVREIRGILAGLEVTLLTLDDVPADRAARGNRADVRGERAAEGALLRSCVRAPGRRGGFRAGDRRARRAPGCRVGALRRRADALSREVRAVVRAGAAGSAARFVCALALAGRIACSSKRAVSSKDESRRRLRAMAGSATTRSSSTRRSADAGRSGRPEIRGQSPRGSRRFRQLTGGSSKAR